MSRLFLRVVLPAVLVWSGEPPLEAQEVLRSVPDLWENVLGAPDFGPYDWIGDITGDGIDDLIVGQDVLSLDGLQLNGRLRVHSGKDFSVLRSYTGTASFEQLGFGSNGFGDLDGDGVPDYMAMRLGPHGFIWSGADGSQIGTIDPFDSAADLGDRNGIGSFVTSFGAFGGPGLVQVHDGLLLRYQLDSPADAVNYGLGLESLGDIDGDGWTDFAAAAPGEFFKGVICESGQVFVHSGREGALLYSIDGPDELSFFGVSMASPGDLTGDGLRDLVIGAPKLGDDCGNFIGGEGQVTFHDGLMGAELGVFDLARLPTPFSPLQGGHLGRLLAPLGDLNGNGYGDVVTLYTSDWNNPSRSKLLMTMIDGGTQELIYVVPDQYGGACAGTTIVRSVGDANGDGFPDFSAGTDCLGTPTSRFDIYSGAPLGVKSLGEPCKGLPGPEPRIGVSGLPLVGSNFRLYLSQVAPGQDAVLVLGSSATHWGRIPLPVRLPGSHCLLRIGPERRIHARASRIRPGEGAAEVALPIPDDPALVGTRFYAQWLLRSARAPRNAGGSSGGVGAFPLHERASTRALAITIRAEALDVPPPGLVTDPTPMPGLATPGHRAVPSGPLRGRAGTPVPPEW